MTGATVMTVEDKLLQAYCFHLHNQEQLKNNYYPSMLCDSFPASKSNSATVSSPFNSFNKDTRKLWFQKHLFKSLGRSVAHVFGSAPQAFAKMLTTKRVSQADQPTADQKTSMFLVKHKNCLFIPQVRPFKRIPVRPAKVHWESGFPCVHIYTFMSHVC